MIPELRARLKPLLDATVEKPAGERNAFIAAACGEDEELRQELEALVDAQTSREESTQKGVGDVRDLTGRAQAKFSPSEIVLSRFKILRQLGSGGMGDVYEALDLELAQTVALKSIRPDIAGIDGVVSRFKKEVQLARRLSGPNICRIHELFVISSEAGAPADAFLTMEFLDGITLTEKVQQAGHIPWREAQTIAIDLCAGLSAMHEAGIIHRDLKSRNIMLTDRGGSQRAVLMDFGLAREVSTSSSTAETALTAPGNFIGTPQYMAPEQFEGKELSPSTDIYAMGVVLYEMLTGIRPFAVRNRQSAAVQQSKRPDPPSSLQKDIPHRIDLVVARCLEYDPDRRYQSAAQLADALSGNTLRLETLKRNWLKTLAYGLGSALILAFVLLLPPVRERIQGVLLSSRVKHVALLPFDIIGSDEENKPLGAGLMDSLSGKLSNLDSANASLWVVPASEVLRLKVTDPSGALREFGATIVVKGSFERHNQAIRLRLTLIDPRKTRVIGFVDVENESGDLASLQNDAIKRLGRLMNISVEDDSDHGSGETAPRAAYEDYLAGLGYFQRDDKGDNIDKAVTSLEAAIKTDPNFVLALARLAQVSTRKYLLTSDPKWLQSAAEYGKRAAELDNRVSSTFVALGQVHELTGNHDLAIQEFQRAISLDPRDSDALSGLGNSYKNAGRTADAETAYLNAIAVRPNDWRGYNDLGIFYERIGRSREAIAQFNRSLGFTPDNSWTYANLGMVYMDFDDRKSLDQAESALKKSIAISPSFGAYSNLGYLYAKQRRFQESVAESKQALILNNKNYDVWDNLTAAYEWLGDEKNASTARARTIDLVEQTVNLNSQNAEAQAKLSALYAKNHARDKAKERINIALALAPDNGYALSQIADAYELLGDRAKAIQILQKALKIGVSRSILSEDPELQYLVKDPRFSVPAA